ncbi:uncharacterized protein F4822DRAFT_310944 [Hypoxylon trugodes]|uniref:uncharacterized protein n=1 Tax=Hypoxylon trugodes TaxID=326681 RepID=UPI00218DBCE8|nr:uncharacterized protein F4822DRAFT_310944 [Hypoxylon trugodes]KAI1386267.1 hypothetical protein F4822DRAFT_310944 [Hypoxylon trugodes]
MAIQGNLGLQAILQTHIHKPAHFPPNLPPLDDELAVPSLVPSTSRPSRSLWPEGTCLIQFTNDQPQDLKEAPNKAKPNQHGQHRLALQFTMKLGENTNEINCVPARDNVAPISQPATPTTPTGFLNIPSQVIPLTSPSSPTNLDHWDAYPLCASPPFESGRSTTSPRKGLTVPEKCTDNYSKQFTLLKEWMKKTNEEIIALRNTKHDLNLPRQLEIYRTLFRQAPDDRTRRFADKKIIEIENQISSHYKTCIQREKTLSAEVLDAYANFVDVRSFEAHASARRRVLEMVHQPQPSPREMSKTERLLGSDGSSSSNPSLPKDNRLYFHGTPLKLTTIPFDQAVASGLEHLGSLDTLVPPSPNTSKPTSLSEPQVRTSNTLSPSTAPSNTSNKLNIPDWFPLLKMQLEGKDVESRWKALLTLLGNLENAARRKDEREAATKKPNWDLNWHHPDPKWRHAHQREHGGWWKCKTGPNALKAEIECLECHHRYEPAEPKVDPRETLRKLNDSISKAMAKVAEKDEAIVLERMRKEKEAYDRDLAEEDQRESVFDASKRGIYQRRSCYNFLRGIAG